MSELIGGAGSSGCSARQATIGERVDAEVNAYKQQIAMLRQDVNDLIHSNQVLKSQLEAQTKIAESLANRLEESGNNIKYGFRNRKRLCSIPKNNGEILTVDECWKDEPGTRYVMIEVQDTNRKVCLRKNEWHELVRGYVKEYLL